MNDNSVSIEDFRANLAEYVNRVRYSRKHVVLKKHNRKAAILISPEEYEWLTDPTARFTKKEWAKGFSVFKKMQQVHANKTPAQLQRAVDKAVKEVRQAKQRKNPKRRK